MSNVIKEKEKINIQIGNRIHMARSCAGLTQTELGVAINVTGKQISKYELGETSCTAWQLKMIADETGVSVNYLVNGSDTDIKTYEIAEKIKSLPKEVQKYILCGIEGMEEKKYI